MDNDIMLSWHDKLIEECIHYEKVGMGHINTYFWMSDPKHLCFTLSRYKFVSKMLSGKKSVLEIGCGDGFCVPIITQEVSMYNGIDISSKCIEIASANRPKSIIDRAEFEVHDISLSPYTSISESAFALDVMEHIPPEKETDVMDNVYKSLSEDSIFIIGTPNFYARNYSSSINRSIHLNYYTYEKLRDVLTIYFRNVFVFSMNDEVVHTGYYKMAHYLFGMGVGKR